MFETVPIDSSISEFTDKLKAALDLSLIHISGTFESNNAGTYFARDVQQILTDRKYVCNIRTKRTISNKQTRIEFASDNIIKHFYFKDPSLYARNSQYAMFMKQVTTYIRSGKVPHDDAPEDVYKRQLSVALCGLSARHGISIAPVWLAPVLGGSAGL